MNMAGSIPRNSRMSDRSPAAYPDSDPDHTIDPALLDPAAVDVTRQLQEAGYEALLVGGCVRDLLLGMSPKDYDVATDATPEQVARVFRRARIIGRRFRIVHVRVGREVIEVTTFRRAPGEEPPQTEHGRILSDNEWGDLDSDAQRRDFTINALYYDPLTNEGIDHVDGLSDLENRVLRIIGDPHRRFAEDPVRMVRAIRFMAKLDFVLAPDTAKALADCRHLLGGVPPARMFDEVLKLFHHGHGERAAELLHAHGMLSILFPVLSPWLDGEDGAIPSIVVQALRNTDRRVRDGKAVIAPFLFAAFLWPPVSKRFESLRADGKPAIEALHRACDHVVAQECTAVSVPRRVSSVVREIWELEQRLGERHPRAVRGLLENRRFRAAYDFMLLRRDAGEREAELCEWWTRIQEAPEAEVVEMISAVPGGGRRRRSRRPRKRRANQ